MSKIEVLINDLDRYVDSCKYLPMSNDKAVIEKNYIFDLIDQLKLCLPDEINRYRKIISNREAILEDAQEKAEKIVAKAQQEAQQVVLNAKRQAEIMVSESEIMQQAYFQANQINAHTQDYVNQVVQKATEDANQIRSSALSYTSDMLNSVEAALAKTHNDIIEQYESTLSTLQENLTMIAANKNEIAGILDPDYLNPSLLEELQDDKFLNVQTASDSKRNQKTKRNRLSKKEKEVEEMEDIDDLIFETLDNDTEDDENKEVEAISKSLKREIERDSLFERITKPLRYGFEDDDDEEYEYE